MIIRTILNHKVVYTQHLLFRYTISLCRREAVARAHQNLYIRERLRWNCFRNIHIRAFSINIVAKTARKLCLLLFKIKRSKFCVGLRLESGRMIASQMNEFRLNHKKQTHSKSNNNTFNIWIEAYLLHYYPFICELRICKWRWNGEYYFWHHCECGQTFILAHTQRNFVSELSGACAFARCVWFRWKQ